MMGEEGVDNGVSETMGGLLEAFPLPLIHVSPAGACSCNKAMCELLMFRACRRKVRWPAWLEGVDGDELVGPGPCRRRAFPVQMRVADREPMEVFIECGSVPKVRAPLSASFR